jgi:hypothetical protein
MIFRKRCLKFKKKLVVAMGSKSLKMGCPALGIWVGFLKQPALPGEAPPPKKILLKKI